MRVHEIAKALGTTSPCVLNYLRFLGCPERSASSMVPLSMAQTIIALY